MYCLGTFSLIYCMSTLRTGVPKWGPRVPKWGQGCPKEAQNPHVLDLLQQAQKSGFRTRSSTCAFGNIFDAKLWPGVPKWGPWVPKWPKGGPKPTCTWPPSTNPKIRFPNRVKYMCLLGIFGAKCSPGVPKWGPRVPKWGQGCPKEAQNPHVLDLPQQPQKSGFQTGSSTCAFWVISGANGWPGVPKWGPRVPKWGQGYAFWAQNPHVLDLPQHTQKSGADQLRLPQIEREREIERDHVRRFFRFSTDSLVIVSLKLSLFHSRLSMDPDVAQTCHCPACCASRRAHCSCLQSW